MKIVQIEIIKEINHPLVFSTITWLHCEGGKVFEILGVTPFLESTKEFITNLHILFISEGVLEVRRESKRKKSLGKYSYREIDILEQTEHLL